MAEEKTKKTAAKKETVSLETLLETGAHFGHQARRWNPKMRDYIYKKEDGVHVFDLLKTKENLEVALKFLREAKKANLKILFIGTKKQAAEKTKEIALATNSFYINTRFLGGTFTNFTQIQKSIKKLEDLQNGLKTGAFEGYTKKEKLLIAREIEDLNKNFSGIAKMTKLPDVVIIVDTKKEDGAVRESKKMNVKIVGLVDTNANPELIDYPIPMNDDAENALNYVLDLIKQALI